MICTSRSMKGTLTIPVQHVGSFVTARIPLHFLSHIIWHTTFTSNGAKPSMFLVLHVFFPPLPSRRTSWCRKRIPVPKRSCPRKLTLLRPEAPAAGADFPDCFVCTPGFISLLLFGLLFGDPFGWQVDQSFWCSLQWLVFALEMWHVRRKRRAS